MASVFWLGGGCGSGKTTIARVLTRRLDLRLYPVDGYTYAHAERSKRGGFPLYRAAAELTPQQRWDATPAELAKRFAAVAAERLQMIRADLDDLGPGPTIVAEGPQLFPDLIAPLLRTPEDGLWLLPTPEFGQHGVAGRRAGGLTGQPAQRRRDRDVLLTEMNRQQVKRHGLPSLDVDGNRSLADTIDMVAHRLENLPGGLVRAADGGHRRRIRQAENAVVVRQLLGWQADLGPERMPDAPPFPFSCECERLGCERTITMSALEYQQRSADGPVTG
jgi:Phage tail assembly chaperone protein, TAC